MTSHQEAAPINGAGHAEATTNDHAEGAVAHENADAGHGEAHVEGHESLTSFKIGFTIPGLQEIGVLIGFLSLFLFFFFRNLERAPLLPLKDPFLEESLHHSTGVYPEGEDGGHDDH